MSLTTIILINAIADIAILGTLAYACTRAAVLRPHRRGLARPRSAPRPVYRAVGAGR
ncbi:MAG TPA: hypothetical protein VKS25_08880 [Solirubrobacteraceae bacterium]|nr:hypothetical protein [Solirubrobacteraceae bacterium]